MRLIRKLILLTQVRCRIHLCRENCMIVASKRGANCPRRKDLFLSAKAANAVTSSVKDGLIKVGLDRITTDVVSTDHFSKIRIGRDRVNEIRIVKDLVNEIRIVKDRIKEIRIVKDRTNEIQIVKDQANETQISKNRANVILIGKDLVLKGLRLYYKTQPVHLVRWPAVL